MFKVEFDDFDSEEIDEINKYLPGIIKNYTITSKDIDKLINFAVQSKNYDLLEIILELVVYELQSYDGAIDSIVSILIGYSLKYYDFDFTFKALRKIQYKLASQDWDKFIRNSINKTALKVFESNNIDMIIALYQTWFKKYSFFGEGIEARKAFLWSSELYDVVGMEDKIFKYIDEMEQIDIAMCLSFEAKKILSNYEKLNFQENPEYDEALKKLRTKMGYGYRLDNFNNFYKYIQKLIKKDKIILALYLLSNFSGWKTDGDIRFLINLYIEAFIALKQYDILINYYNITDSFDSNIEVLLYITDFYMDQKKINDAKDVIKKIEMIEPSHPYIQFAKDEIESISLRENLLQHGINLSNIENMKGQEFENLLIAQFEKLGFSVTETPVTGDFGADIIIDTEDETRFIIQCKRFKNKVNLKAVQEVVAAIAHFNGDIGIVITNNTFLNSAIKLAQSNDVELWGEKELMKFLNGDMSFSQISEL